MSIKYSKNSQSSRELFLREAAVKGLRISSHVSLSEYSPSKIGAVAEFVSVAEDLAQLVELVKLAIAFKVNYSVVGSMYATLPSDGGIKGMVIINKTNNLFFIPGTSQVVVDGGVNLQHLVTAAASKGLGGIEYLVVVPGTIGGAIITGVYVGTNYIYQVIKEVNLLINEGGKTEIKTFLAKDLPFKNGELLFPNPINSPVLLSAKLQLTNLTVREVLERISNYRKISKVENMFNRFGYVFNVPIKELLSEENKKQIFTSKLIGPSKKDADIFELKKGVTATELNNLFLQIENLDKETLRQRVSYLGYWQNNGEELA